MGNMAYLSILPEIILLVGALLVLMASVALELPRRLWMPIAWVSLLAAAGVSIWQWLRIDDLRDAIGALPLGADLATLPSELLAFGAPGGGSSMVVMDWFGAFAGVVIFVVAALALLAAWDLIEGFTRRAPEYVALVLLATAGLHLMAISSNLILLFIGLETASISLYVIAGFTREEKNSDEAAMKYFLLGSFASAVFLYGVALVFAGFGSVTLYGPDGIAAAFVLSDLRFELVFGEPAVPLIGLAMITVGLGFKVSAAPFHQWAPDVYQGAPGGAVPLMSAGVKIAGFAALARILAGGFDPAWLNRFAPMIALLAALSVVVGTMLAIAQSDFKRMIAYSGVAHAGFLLTALVAGRAGIPGMWFYLATYAFALVGVFTIAAVMTGPRGGPTAIDDFAGLARRSPVLAGAMALLMLSLGGIPFTAGFVGKVGVFAAAIDAGYLWLAIVGLVVAVAGLFFYLRVIVVMYFQAPQLVEGPGTAQASAVHVSASARTVIAVTAAVTFVFGVVPWPLLEWVEHALPL
jgi:NADH-quinone oxidoreductase subunit N